MWPRAILHVDMDAFYASVEQRDRPELRGLPVIVGGSGRRGVVSSPSYEARRFGVKSAMPMWTAMKLCPHAIAVPPRMARYLEVSRDVMAIFGRFTPLVEPLSLDEAFLDITGTEALFGPPVSVAQQVQRAIRSDLSLSASVGLAATKYVAKVASDLQKPGGLVVVPPGEERAFLAPLALERLWGVGPKTAARLHALGFVTIGDVAAAYEPRAGAPRADLAHKLGGDALVEHIGALAVGEDPRPVEPEHTRKSLGSERTLERDIQGRARVQHELLPLVDDVAAQLRAERLRAGGVRLKIKYADFKRASRELHLEEPVLDAQSLLRGIEQLCDRIDLDRPIRLIGLAAIALVEDTAPLQSNLFAQAPTGRERAERLGRAVDAIKGKFGADAVVRASAKPRER
jgi:DNA polymerase-4